MRKQKTANVIVQVHHDGFRMDRQIGPITLPKSIDATTYVTLKYVAPMRLRCFCCVHEIPMDEIRQFIYEYITRNN